MGKLRHLLSSIQRVRDMGKFRHLLSSIQEVVVRAREWVRFVICCRLSSGCVVWVSFVICCRRSMGWEGGVMPREWVSFVTCCRRSFWGGYG